MRKIKTVASNALINKESVISTLKLFIEKADKLIDSKFVKNITGSGVKLQFAVGQGMQISRAGPDQENMEAFVLTFRYFIQNNETISLMNISKVFHSPYGVDEDARDIDSARINLNNYLDSNTMFNLDGVITRIGLRDTFIYGGLAHANEVKKKEFDSWMANPLLAKLMENEFMVILYNTLDVIVYVQKKCEKMLKMIDN